MSKLRRKQGTRVPRKAYVIVCEGEKTERIYFNRYKSRYSNLKIETPNSKCTDPKNLAKFASVESTIQYCNIYDLTRLFFPVIFKTQIYTDLCRFKVASA